MQLLLRIAFALTVGVIVACGPDGEPSFGESPKAASTSNAGNSGDAGAPDGKASKPVGPFACDTARPGPKGDQDLVIPGADGKERDVILHVPQSYDPKKGAPLVIAFHGYGGNAKGMRTQTDLDSEADARGFLTAYLNGVGLASKGFNAGDCCGQPAWQSEIDDVALVRDIAKKITTDYCVDPKRVYSAGFSNGGFMSYRLACEASDLFAAVASMSGVLGIPPEECKPKRPVPLIHLHGTADKTVPFEGGGAAGGLGGIVGITFRSVVESTTVMRDRAGCKEGAKEVAKSEDTRCEAWQNCKDGAAVELCTITEGGHQWAGGKGNIGSGKTSEFPGTKTIVDFLMAHPMP